MTIPDFMESDSDALSQILRSVAPPGAGGGGGGGVGAPPLVRVVRGTGGVEGRWTEVRLIDDTHVTSGIIVGVVFFCRGEIRHIYIYIYSTVGMFQVLVWVVIIPLLQCWTALRCGVVWRSARPGNTQRTSSLPCVVSYHD